MSFISKNIRTALFIFFLTTTFQSTAQCLLSDSDDTEAEVINCLINCGCAEVVIPEGVDITMADSWDLRAEGDIVFRIEGNASRLLFTGVGNNAKQLRLSQNSTLIIDDISNSSAIEADGALGKIRIYFGNTFYNGNQFPDIVAAGGATADGMLPVELIVFDAVIEKGEVLLNWQTATEINHKEFIVEHSLDGSNFNVIGSLAGSGNSIEISDYHFIHHSPSKGYNFYRLKLLDLNGDYSYSTVVSIRHTDQKVKPQLTPTLANDFIHIKDSDRQLYNYVIVNSMGKAVQGGVSDTGQIDVSRLLPGNYHLLILNDQSSPWLQFVKM